MSDLAVGTVMGQLTQLPSGLFRRGVVINIYSGSIFYLHSPRTFGSHLVSVLILQMCIAPGLHFIMPCLLIVGYSDIQL